ncbi:MAG TPA: sulfatase [Vicinamibacteria bacterium]|nr:sulfatase [Vicinamibacteria bacterium]
MKESRAALVLVAVVVGACRSRPAPPGGVSRLLPALGAPALRALDPLAAGVWGRVNPAEHVETVPSVAMRSGQTLSCEARVGPGSLLNYSFAVLPSSPQKGWALLHVRVGGKEVARVRLSVEDRSRWERGSVRLEASGSVRVEFEAEHTNGAGVPFPAAEESPSPWMALGSPRVESPKDAAQRRVFVWISQDTLRADHLGAFGYPRPTSPAFDALSREWITFENGVSTASWTLPSLTSQFTSRYPSFHGAVIETQARDPRFPTLFEVLAQNGFLVAGVTGNPFVSNDFSMAAGFDDLVFDHGRAKDLNLWAIRALKDFGGEDLALLVHYQDPHSPYEPPYPYDRLFSPSGGPPDVEEREQKKALYDGLIAYADHEIAALLDSLRRRGLLQNAVIVYSADHGEEFLDHGGWLHARTLYQEMLHVPFAIRVPGLRGRRVSEVVSLCDLAPTVLDALGIPKPGSFQGTSLLPLLKGGGFREAPVFAETERNPARNHLVAVREGETKYILTLARGGQFPSDIRSEELFDLRADPGEAQPVHDPDKKARYRRLVQSFLARAASEEGSAASSTMSPEVRERLRALGYIQ